MKRGARLLNPGYARLLRRVIDGGATWLDIADALGVERMTAQQVLAFMWSQRLLYVWHWIERPVGKRIERTPVFAFGSGEDAPWPGEGKPRLKRPARVRTELLAFCNAIKALQEEAQLGITLAEASGMSKRVARDLIPVLHGLKLVFIEDYEKREHGGWGYPMWRFGIDQPDKPKPRRRSARELWQKHNAIKSQRRAQARVLRILATGSPKRRNTAAQQEEPCTA